MPKKEKELKRTGKGGDLSRFAASSQFFAPYDPTPQKKFQPVDIKPLHH